MGGRRTTDRRVAALLLVAAGAMVAALIGELAHVNGPSYWTWPWMDLGVARCLLALAPGLGLVGLGFLGLGVGLVASLALFFAYHLVLVGACLAGAWMLGIATAPDRRATVRRFVGALGWAVAGLLVVDGGLSAAFGYHPLASLGTALQHQATVAASWNRPWRLAVGWNLWDLLLGAGVVVSMLALLAVGRAARTRPATTGSRWTLLSLGALLFVDLVGPMRGETARLSLFLQPLWVVPAGLELARRGPRVRVAALAGQAAVLVATLAKLGWIFVERPPA